MPIFFNTDKEALETYLYNSTIHDAEVEKYHYEKEKKVLLIDAVNPIFKEKIVLVFYNIKNVFWVSGTEMGNRETILSLTVENEDAYIKKSVQKQQDDLNKPLYFLFQMFSGDELHVVAEKVFIDFIHEVDKRQ